MEFNVTVKFFFDRKSVLDAVGKPQAAILSKAGAYIRRDARSSFKSRTGKKNRHESSPVGTPPFVHTKDRFASLKNILFAWDPASRSVVIGPVALHKVSFVQRRAASGKVPQVHEFGGTLGVLEVQQRDGAWVRADLRSRRRMAGRPTRIRTANYRPRPFMKPAMDRELPQFPQLWKNAAVRGN